MRSKFAYVEWLKIRLFGILLILITLPSNKGVAQFKSNLYLNRFRQEMTVIKDVRQQELLTGLPLGANYNMERGIAVGIRSRNKNGLIKNDLSALRESNYRINKDISLSPFPGSWVGNEDHPSILRIKKFDLASILRYDKEVDKFDFNLKGQVELSSRVSVQMAVFIFHVPRPRSVGAGDTSSISPYQLQGSFQLQKLK